MKHEEMFKIVKDLPFDEKKVVCTDEDVEIYLLRPSVLKKRFKGYDLNKNFQIWLKEKDKEFRPNHLRLMIDLNLRVRSRPDLKLRLFRLFDDIFYHKDPEDEIKKFEKETFKHSLNSLKIIANLAQLFLIEQEYCYHRESKYEPPTLFFQGWIREFIDNPKNKDIDILCMSVANRQPPEAKYTNKENKKGKKFQESLRSLWYLEN